MKYRPDIDGLRALAVISVVFYHGNIPAFSGGFTGVDIFFVISGYLITKIIATDLETGHFSLLNFYERRVKRILPALMMMMAVVLAAGYFSLLPSEYKALAESAKHGVLFASNVFFAENTGYFDGPAHDMPMLHTWSLAIEEQFYLLWPLLLWGLWKYARARRWLFWSLIAIAGAVSLAISIHSVTTDAKDAFYLLPSRAWELLLGCVLALLGGEAFQKWARFSGVLSLLGLALIGWGVFALTHEDPFPGHNALFPCLGAAFLILAGELRDSPVRRLLSVAPLTFIGKISYSLYLWHWPIFVFYQLHMNTNTLSLRESSALIAVSVVTAVLSWKFIEQPARQSQRGWRVHFTYGAVATAVVGIAAVLVDETRGALNRLPPDLARMSSRAEMWEWKCPQTLQIAGPSGKPSVCALGAPWEKAAVKGILWGDSHAEHFAPLLDGIARDANISLVLWRSCPAYIDNKRVKRFQPNQPLYSEWCAQGRARALDWLRSDPSIQLVVLAAAWVTNPRVLYDRDRNVRSFEQGAKLMEIGLDAVIQEINPNIHRILLISDVPRAGRDIANCVLLSQGGLLGRHCDADWQGLDATVVKERHSVTNNILQDAAARWDGVDLVLVTDRICGERTCPTFVNGEFIYRDSHHLRRNLSEQTRRALAEMIGLDVALGLVD